MTTLDTTPEQQPAPVVAVTEIQSNPTEWVINDIDLVDDKSDETEGKAEAPKVEEPTILPQNVTFNEAELISGKRLPDEPSISFPPDSEEKIVKTLANLPNLPVTESDKGRLWAATLQDCADIVSYDEMFESALRRPGSDWKTGVDVNGAVLRGGYPTFGARKNSEMEGSRAVVHVLSHLGIGSLYSQPMWHSGFWVSFKPATESELIDLNHLMASDKVAFGRYTYGLAFSNLTAYTAQRLLNFAQEHIYLTSIDPKELGDLKILDLLRTQDIPAFLTGYMAAQYPRGFNYRRPCCNDPQQCTHVAEDTIDLRWLTKEDSSQLTPYQKGHMTNRRDNSMTLESVRRYQTEMISSMPREVTINQTVGNSITFVLSTPSAYEYIDAGHRWIGQMSEMVDSVLGKEAGSVERNTLLQQHGMASILCQFSHWIKGIRFADAQINSRETVENIIKLLSSDDEIRQSLIKAIKKYINDSTIAVVGIPVYKCPACQTLNEPKDKPDRPLFRELIPVDVFQVFTRLVRHRIGRLARR